MSGNVYHIFIFLPVLCVSGQLACFIMPCSQVRAGWLASSFVCQSSATACCRFNYYSHQLLNCCAETTLISMQATDAKMIEISGE